MTTENNALNELNNQLVDIFRAYAGLHELLRNDNSKDSVSSLLELINSRFSVVLDSNLFD